MRILDTIEDTKLLKSFLKNPTKGHSDQKIFRCSPTTNVCFETQDARIAVGKLYGL